MTDSTRDVQDEIDGIKREIRSIQWLLWVALAGVALLVAKAYSLP